MFSYASAAGQVATVGFDYTVKSPAVETSTETYTHRFTMAQRGRYKHLTEGVHKGMVGVTTYLFRNPEMQSL